METISLDEILWFQEGPGVRNYQYTDSGVKLINVTNLVSKKLDLSLTNRFISEEEAYGKYKHFLCDDGDLVIASSGITYESIPNKVSFVSKENLPLCMNTSVIRFKVLDRKKTNIDYVYYFFKSNNYRNQIFKLMTGSAQLNYGPMHLHKVKFKNADIKEQNYRVELLNHLTFQIYKDKEELVKLDELIKSRFIEMFEGKKFPFVKFEEYMERCVDIGSNGANAVVMEHYNITNSKEYAMVIRFTNLNSNDFTDDVKYLNENDYNFFSKSKVFGGEIIFCKIGSAGLNYIMPKLDIPVTLGLNQIMITPKNINTIYLYNYINSDEGLEYISKHTQGAVTKTITKHALWDFPIMTPPIELQNEFASFVEQIDKSKFIIQKRIDLYQELLDKKMCEYFGD